jgi:hypothetical protein
MNLGGSRTTQATFRTHFAVLCTDFWQFWEREGKREKKDNKETNKQKTHSLAISVATGSHSTEASGTVLCYKNQI